jgi:uncharacterized protein (TIGR01244 family)
MRLLSLSLALVLAPAFVTSAFGDPGPGGIGHYTRVDATVACAGATPPGAMPALKADGFRSVLNLRMASETGADIDAARRAAEAAGLRYIHLPVDAANLSGELVDRFLAVMRDPQISPVLIHCATANRVGMLWLVKRVAIDGWPVEKATEEAERVGLKSPKLKAFALDYLKARAD